MCQDPFLRDFILKEENVDAERNLSILGISEEKDGCLVTIGTLIITTEKKTLVLNLNSLSVYFVLVC